MTHVGEVPGQCDKVTYYRDLDGDGFGDHGYATLMCPPCPMGFADNDQDCDDTNPAINPAAQEVCDELDNDCDGDTDEGVKNTYYRDEDRDGYGDLSNPTQACTCPAGYAENATDCDDTDYSLGSFRGL